jgi:hypothetical protein
MSENIRFTSSCPNIEDIKLMIKDHLLGKQLIAKYMQDKDGTSEDKYSKHLFSYLKLTAETFKRKTADVLVTNGFIN